MRSLHQMIPVLDPGDAASNHTLQVQRLLRDRGFVSEIFTDETHPSLAALTRPTTAFPGGPVIYQFAIGSPQADRVASAPDPVAVVSHNVTPAHFFEAWDPPLVHGCTWGRQQLEMLARATSLGIGVSRYNADDLDALGCRHTAVAPILLDTSAFEREVDTTLLDRLRADRAGADWLFVGRLVPNKAQHDIIKAFVAYRRTIDGRARLRLVGGASSARYESALRRFVAGAGVGDAVTFTGGVGPSALAAHYAAADVFVCLSDHEGFCVPLLEAMHHRLPIVTWASSAIPETLGDGGICLPEKSPAVVASAVARVLDDDAVRAQVVDGGTARLADFALGRTRARFAAVIEPWHASVT